MPNNKNPIAVKRSRLYFAWADRVFRWLLAAVFFLAAIPKLFSPVDFSGIIEAYGLVPEILLLPAAVILPLVELIAGIQLIRAKRSGLWLTALLMVLFIGVLSYAVWMGFDIDCGCFGPEDPEHQAFAQVKTALIRDLLLCIPLVFCIVYSYKTRPEQYGEKE